MSGVLSCGGSQKAESVTQTWRRSGRMQENEKDGKEANINAQSDFNFSFILDRG